MTDRLDKIDVHVRFRIEEVRDALRRRRRNLYLRRFALKTCLVIAATVAFWFLIRPYGLTVHLARAAFWILEVFLFWKLLYKPLKHPITNQHAALFIDQQHPELQDRVTSMVAMASNKERPGWMEEDFLKEARGTVSRSRFGEDWHIVRPASMPLLGPLLLGVALLIMFRFPVMWQPFYGQSWALAQPYKIEPGNARVQTGDDLIVLVEGGHSEREAMILWKGASGSWQEESMKTGDSDDVRFYRFIGIHNNFHYRVRVGSWKSDVYKVETWLPPEVMSIDLTYTYPEYLNLPPREVSNGGQITALEGSDIHLKVQVNKALDKAEMVFESGRRIRLEEEDTLSWSGHFVADQNDIYHLELVDRNGESGVFQPSYEILVKSDLAPIINIEFPYNDLSVSPLDEVPFFFEANDDFGLESFGLRIQVEGRDPQLLTLGENKEDLLQMKGEYLLNLEDMDLTPGDLVNWTVWARDRKPDRAEYETLGPPYFLEIRPFKRLFREAVSDSGQQGAGGGDNLLTAQKEIVIAIWNLRRISGNLDGPALEEKTGAILEKEESIVEQVAGSMDQSNEEVGELIGLLEETVDHLQKTSLPEPQGALSRAVTSARAAYQLLLKLEPEESRIQRSRSNASGQSGSMRQPDGTQQLEMDRNRNYYETERLTQNRRQAVKDALDKLDDLTRRQQLINDEIAGLISELEKEDDPESRRRLERLQEEIRKNIEKLDEMQRDIANMDPRESQEARDRLDQARQQMNRGLENLEQGQLQEARAAGARAMEDLQQLEENLEQQAQGSAEERVEDLRNTLTEMRRRQEEIKKRVAESEGKNQSPSLESDLESDDRQDLVQTKKEMAENFKKLMEDASQLEQFARGSQELLARKLGDWLRETSREGVLEDIEETTEMAGYGMWDELAEKEQDLEEKLNKVGQAFDEAARHLVKDELDAKEKAVAELTDLLQQMPSRNLTEQEAKRWTEKGYKNWLEGMDNAQTYLGSGSSSAPRDLERIRREIQNIRRKYRGSGDVPDGDLLVDAVVKPLQRTTDQLMEELRAVRREREFVLQDDGSIPDQYRKNVSEYFRLLSESEDGN